MLLRFNRLSQFWPEWIGLAGIALLDVALIRHTGFHLLISWRAFALGGLVLGVTAALRTLRLGPAAVIGEYLALNIVLTPVFGVLTYLCMAMSGAWADAPLLAIDRALGFDWLSGFRFVIGHPPLFDILRLVYDSILVQSVYLAVLFGLMRRTDRLREIFRILFVSLFLTCVGAVLFPALGPFKLFGLESHGSFLHDMEKLHAHRDLTFALLNLTGVIGFPSFHTTLALLYAYAFRGTGVIGYLMAGLNGVMLLAIPFIGGHYVADMLGGALVMLASLAIVRLPDRLHQANHDDVFAGAGLQHVLERMEARPQIELAEQE